MFTSEWERLAAVNSAACKILLACAEVTWVMVLSYMKTKTPTQWSGLAY
jgi:hypothetical protein